MNDTGKIQQIARAKGAFLVDDAAQALGANREGCPAGTRGDVGLYSFGRGKVLANLEGGLVVTRSNLIAEAVQREIGSLPLPSLGHNFGLLIKLVAYAAFLHPHLYWIPSSLPVLKLGVTEFDPDYPATRVSGLSLAVSHRLLPEAGGVAETRRRLAGETARLLQGHPKFTMLKVPPDCQPSFIRFPVLARDEATRGQAIARLRKAGISATVFYPSAICDIGGIDRYIPSREFHKPAAESLSRRLLTLPTSAYLTGKDLERMGSALWSV
jgi:dTDP-4-amino-4,6-dideoxygalactose transaminase